VIAARQIIGVPFQPEHQMASGNGQDESLSRLEREAERNRAQLVNTVGALHDRVSPQALKRDVQEYVQDKRQELLNNLQRNVRENPLQAVAVAAGVAYPLWRLAASIPVPILLIGAGLALTRSKQSAGGSRMWDNAVERGQEAMGEATDTLRRTYHDARDAVADKAQQSMQQATEATQGLRDQVATGADKLAKSASSTVTSAAEAARDLGANAAGVANAATEKLKSAYETGSETLRSAYEGSVEAAADAGEQITQATRRAQESLTQSIEQHPLLVAGIGLGLGALLASVLPSTRAENRVFGELGDGLKTAGEALAVQGFVAAKETAAQAYADAAQHARDQGLSIDAAREALSDVAGRVQGVAERTIGGTQQQPSSTPTNSPQTNAPYASTGRSPIQG
jgi:ElaB/YqjD/DUF883 family membrane-anchored ribosome-binding protein